MTSRLRHLPPVLLAALVFAVAPALAQQGIDSGPNYETRLQMLEDQTRTLQGRIEQLEFATRRSDQALQRMQADIDARLAKMESAAAQPVSAPPAVAAPSAPPPPAVTNIAPANGTLGALKMQDGRITGAVSNPKAPPLPDAPADYGLTPQEQYDRAFGLLRQASYDEAGKAFKTFIERNPQDKLVNNARYWYGETLYVRGQFDAAAVAFADAYQQDAKGGKAPDSLLKMAMSLGALDKAKDACTTLDSLRSRFPNAPLLVRQRAEEERAKLKCS